MNVKQFISGKISLNHYVHRISQHGASFHVHYWGVMPEHFDTSLHRHSFFEVCYVVDGTGMYLDNGNSYSLQKNTMFISRPDIVHQIKSKEGLFLLYVGFELIESESSEEWIKIMEEARQCSKVVIHAKDDTAAASLWKSLIIHATKPHNPYLKEMLVNLASALILSLLQSFVSFSDNGDCKTLPEASSSLLEQAKFYIQDHLSEPLKLTETASHLHISGRHLSRIFVSELGVSYSEFVQNARIQKAAALLKTTDLSIKDIAEECGFTTVHYFTRIFTSVMGSSPGRFRSLYTDLKTTTFAANA